MEKLKILKWKRAKNKKAESEKFAKAEMLNSKRAKNKMLECEKFGKIKNIQD